MERLSRERTNQRTKLSIGKITKRLLVSSLPFFFLLPFFLAPLSFFPCRLIGRLKRTKSVTRENEIRFIHDDIYIYNNRRWQDTVGKLLEMGSSPSGTNLGGATSFFHLKKKVTINVSSVISSSPRFLTAFERLSN